MKKEFSDLTSKSVILKTDQSYKINIPKEYKPSYEIIKPKEENKQKVKEEQNITYSDKTPENNIKKTTEIKSIIKKQNILPKVNKNISQNETRISDIDTQTNKNIYIKTETKYQPKEEKKIFTQRNKKTETIKSTSEEKKDLKKKVNKNEPNFIKTNNITTIQIQKKVKVPKINTNLIQSNSGVNNVLK